EVNLSYFARNASWKPSYDLRAKDIKGQVSLLYKASVTQNTGENWENVHVMLSTGNPTLGGNKPELVPWYLSFLMPRYDRQSSIESMGMNVPARSKETDTRIDEVFVSEVKVQ